MITTEEVVVATAAGAVLEEVNIVKITSFNPVLI